MITIPKCLRCTHVKKGMKCDAYPDGIPSDILLCKKEVGKRCNNSKIGYTEKKASE